MTLIEKLTEGSRLNSAERLYLIGLVRLDEDRHVVNEAMKLAAASVWA